MLFAVSGRVLFLGGSLGVSSPGFGGCEYVFCKVFETCVYLIFGSGPIAQAVRALH